MGPTPGEIDIARIHRQQRVAERAGSINSGPGAVSKNMKEYYTICRSGPLAAADLAGALERGLPLSYPGVVAFC